MKPGPIPKVSHLPFKEATSPQYVAPDCPKHITGYALEEWERIVPLLVQYKLITNIDTVALALYCDSYGVWQQAKERQEKAGGDGLMIKSPNGYPIQNPYLAIINRAKEDCYKYLQQFGLSPAARTRVIPAAQGTLDIGEDEEKCRNYFT